MIEHDGCKGCRDEKESADSKYCIGCLQNATDKYVRMTNYDRIKNMSVEEIADILFASCQEYIDCDSNSALCKGCVTLWLNSECDLPEGVEE